MLLTDPPAAPRALSISICLVGIHYYLSSDRPRTFPPLSPSTSPSSHLSFHSSSIASVASPAPSKTRIQTSRKKTPCLSPPPPRSAVPSASSTSKYKLPLPSVWCRFRTPLFLALSAAVGLATIQRCLLNSTPELSFSPSARRRRRGKWDRRGGGETGEALSHSDPGDSSGLQPGSGVRGCCHGDAMQPVPPSYPSSPPTPAITCCHTPPRATRPSARNIAADVTDR